MYALVFVLSVSESSLQLVSCLAQLLLLDLVQALVLALLELWSDRRASQARPAASSTMT